MIMTCQQAIDEFLTDYVEGRLSFGQRARFVLHLAICSHCRRYLDTYRSTIAAGRAVANPEGPISPEVPEELIRAILAAKSEAKD